MTNAVLKELGRMAQYARAFCLIGRVDFLLHQVFERLEEREHARGNEPEDLRKVPFHD